MERTTGGDFSFSRPDGREVLEVPPQMIPVVELTSAEDAVAGIEGWLTEARADADWKARDPEWDGGRLDLDFALDALWTSRNPSAPDEIN